MTAKGRAVLDAAWAATGRELAGHLADVPAERLAAVADAMAVVRELFGSLGLPEPQPPPPPVVRRPRSLPLSK